MGSCQIHESFNKPIRSLNFTPLNFCNLEQYTLNVFLALFQGNWGNFVTKTCGQFEEISLLTFKLQSFSPLRWVLWLWPSEWFPVWEQGQRFFFRSSRAVVPESLHFEVILLLINSFLFFLHIMSLYWFLNCWVDWFVKLSKNFLQDRRGIANLCFKGCLGLRVWRTPALSAAGCTTGNPDWKRRNGGLEKFRDLPNVTQSMESRACGFKPKVGPFSTWQCCLLGRGDTALWSSLWQGALTRPSSLSSKARTPVLSVNNFTFTAGSAWVVEKSPWVPQLQTESERSAWSPLP